VVLRGFWLGRLRAREHLEDPGLDGRIILIFKWTEFIWFRIGTGGGLL
jgi:hypothetical protein